MKARDIEKAIEADGWYRIKSKGHRQYKHPTRPGRVTIPWHKNGNEDLNPKTLASIE
jgi:predicted RNA binding protein YcfA (HicA-like mRNA interferase family)